jgi:hypothetical protein
MYVFNAQFDAQGAECHINVCAHMLHLMQGAFTSKFLSSAHQYGHLILVPKS